jgi:transposase
MIGGMSENPKILLWDVGNGITQNFGKHLNYLKNLWPVVQQQDYLKHKAAQEGVPVIEIKYNKCNDLICSACGAKQINGKKPVKVITQLIQDVRNFKCQKCRYEVNTLINQANNIINLQ